VSTTTAARPRQTTMAGVMVMLAATFVVLSVADTVSRLRSIETREAIEKVLADAPSNLNLSVESTIQLLHVVAIVAALCSVAAVALGWQALQGSRSARMALAVLAFPIFITGLVAGGFMSSLVAVASAMLWLSPSREWFAGKPIPDLAQLEQARRDAKVQALNGKEPGPVIPAAGWNVGAPAPARIPDPVRVALVLTIVMAGLVLTMTLASLVVLITQPDVVLEELRKQNAELEKQGISDTVLLTTAYVSGGLVVAWSALAVVLAVLTAKRRVWAARGLLLSAGACALFCVISAFVQPIAVIPAVAAIATVGRLRRSEVRAWLDAR
jgi:hypothetical protein